MYVQASWYHYTKISTMKYLFTFFYRQLFNLHIHVSYRFMNNKEILMRPEIFVDLLWLKL